MRKIIVTGGLGFIGSNLIELLINKKFEVINLDKVTYSSNFYNTKGFTNSSKYRFIKCDLNDKNKLSKVIFRYKDIIRLINYNTTTARVVYICRRSC